MTWIRRYKTRVKMPLAQKKQRYVRTYLAMGLMLVFGSAIIVQLLSKQVFEAGTLHKKALSSRQQSGTLFSRGRIVDRNGIILAQDSILYDLYAHPVYYWDVKPQTIAETIAPFLKKPVDLLATTLSKDLPTIRVARNLPKPVVDGILKARITQPLIDPKTRERLFDEDGHLLTKRIAVPGMDFSKKTVRKYPQGDLAAHVLGYLNDEAGISAGVEYSASATLKKRPLDMAQPTLDGRGRLIGAEEFRPESIVNIAQSDDVRLTIDSKLQYIAEEALKAGVERSKAEKGTVVMMNPRSGEILAFALFPKYNPEYFFKSDATQLKNYALSDVYPPGSTFKILTVACGLDTGAIQEDTKLQDTGRMKVGGWTIENYDYHQRPNPGMITLTYLLQHSSNIGSAKIALLMDKQQYWDRLNRFGIGRKTGIDLPGESAGILLPPNQWDISTKASMGYGYGIASTPIQLAAAVSAIANDGVWVQPHVIQDGKPLKRRRVLSTEAARTTTKLLAQSIASAKTSTVRLEGIALAGKTGTSKKPLEDGRGYSNKRYTSFVGYFPANAPEVLVMVVIDSPSMGESWGSTVAGPIFKEIGEKTARYLGIKSVTIASKPSS